MIKKEKMSDFEEGTEESKKEELRIKKAKLTAESGNGEI